jgi:7,8-dihydroneopterin aldolase/epimerase/oxygenase
MQPTKGSKMIQNNVSDKVLIQELKITASVGCGEEQRPTRQQLVLNVEIQYDGRVAAASYKLTDTIDYVKVARLITQLASEQEWPVIESLGDRLCYGILERFSPAKTVCIQMRKFVICEAKWSAVEIYRERGDR